MNVVALQDPSQLRLRAHPWIDSDTDSRSKYYNFKENPELIRTAIEDLVPWGGHAATEAFYQLLESLNGPDGVLESNDCAFAGVYPNDSPYSTRAWESSGRVMVLFRDLVANTSPERVGALAQRVARALSALSPELEAIVGVSLVDVEFTALPQGGRRGQQLMLSFWAWGDDEAQTLAGVERTLSNLRNALRGVD